MGGTSAAGEATVPAPGQPVGVSPAVVLAADGDGDKPARRQVRLLGPVEVLGPAGPALLVGARQRAVVGLLALKAGTVVPQWRLVDALWGQHPPRTAVKSLHSHVARVRSALTLCGLPDVLVTRESGYALRLAPETVDAIRFEEFARRGRDALAAGAPERAVARLREGLGLWRHEVALADAEPTGWGAAEVDRLSEVRLAAIEDRWDAELQLGRHVDAVGELERLLVEYPSRERLVALLMLALYRCGRQTDALDAYQRLRAGIAEEFGVDPGPELARLHTRILRRDPGLDPEPAPVTGPPAAPVPAGPTGAGRVVAAGMPTGTEPPAGPPMPTPMQLPAPVGFFTGRAPELSLLDQLLDDPGGDLRLALISGPGGIGKTALAVQWGRRVAGRFPDGQLFVDLRGHDRESTLPPGHALSHMLRSLGVPADRIPAELTEQASLYRSLLHGRRILIVLDNAGTADDVLPLVPASVGTMLVVTSRSAIAALNTHHAVCAVSLDVLPDHEALTVLTRLLGVGAVQRERAAAAELVRLCDRMPLALRIAAAKLASRPSRTIGNLVTELAGANRLDALTVDGGSRSVRTVFASAYRALSAPAARLFRLLGLHPGPTFHTLLAAAVADLPPQEARRIVDELVVAHLAVETGVDQYRFHDLIALFAQQCAAVDETASGREDAVLRIVDWYLAVATAANRVLDPGRDRVTAVLRHPPAEPPFPAEHHAALAFLDAERGNLLPITRYAAEHGLPTAAWQLTYLLIGFYDSRGHWPERVEMCRFAVSAARQIGDPATEGLMLSGLGVAHIMARRFDAALTSLHEALPLMLASGDQRGAGHVYNNIAAAYSGLRRFDEAVTAFRHALAIHTASGYRLGIALALNNTGHTYVRMGRPERSAADLAEALAIAREVGNPRLEAAVLHSLGEADLGRGALDEALDHLGRALLVYQAIGDRRYEAETMNGLGLALLRKGDPVAATSPLRRALLLTRDLADQHLEAVTRHNMGQAYLAAGDLAAAAEELGHALALRGRIPDPYEEARVRRDLGELGRRLGDRTGAEQHWRLAVTLYRRANAVAEAGELAVRLERDARPVAAPGTY
ncbi:DNA-binding SARP family transcriptional activator [Micromonospora pisi]|uniref:DNA-binding SARP family transcriptional activator n=1 Tax=Micromonospora pisi TaxID=589240 RepID=A0A495JST6_9ACTN|nr:BTAD domain-containing putative transcriptional regulator [Micromonospora pisi]RKR92057.1 DNA-binding SARP family transcriptional activator [Micromonospora pisi]